MESTGRPSLMAMYAHPDDESFGNGGTLAKYAKEGVFTSLVCATRGEAGEISDPALATPDTLGSVREQELRDACSILGVGELIFLDYVDGTLPDVDSHEAEGKIVAAIRRLRPQVIFTFGPEGVYGHPDHVTVSRWATSAFHAAGDPSAYPEQLKGGLEAWSPLKLYYVAPSRERFQKMGEMAAQFVPDTTWSDRDWSSFGVPEAKITTCVPTADYAETKMAAIMAHRTQVMPNHPYSLLPTHLLEEFFREECYMLAKSRVGRTPGRETDLFRGVRA